MLISALPGVACRARQEAEEEKSKKRSNSRLYVDCFRRHGVWGTRVWPCFRARVWPHAVRRWRPFAEAVAWRTGTSIPAHRECRRHAPSKKKGRAVMRARGARRDAGSQTHICTPAAYIVMAFIFMAYIVMAYIVMALYSYGPI